MEAHVVKIGRPGLPEHERRRVWDLWKEGNSFSQIARCVGVPTGSVYFSEIASSTISTTQRHLR